MTRIGSDKTPHSTTQPDPMVQRGFSKDAEVRLPLDFLQGIAANSYRNLELRPPRLRFDQSPKDTYAQVSIQDLEITPQLSKETEEVAYELAELLLRIKPQVKVSDDIGARRGLEALERTCRMFVHVYEARTR